VSERRKSLLEGIPRDPTSEKMLAAMLAAANPDCQCEACRILRSAASDLKSRILGSS